MQSVIIPSQLRKVRWGNGGPPKVIHLSGDIDEDSANTFVENYNEAMQTGQNVIPVMIHSTGGDVYSALKIHDVIKSSHVPVVTCVCGAAMSAAAFIFTSGTERYISEHSTIMLHDVAIDFFSGKINDVVVETAEMKRLNQKMWSLMSENCGLEPDFFKKKLVNSQNTDAYITPQNALSWGLATAIGVPRLETRVSVESFLVTGKSKGGGATPTPATNGGGGAQDDNASSSSSSGEESSPEANIPRPKGRKPRNAIAWDGVKGEWTLRKRKR